MVVVRIDVRFLSGSVLRCIYFNDFMIDFDFVIWYAYEHTQWVHFACDNHEYFIFDVKETIAWHFENKVTFPLCKYIKQL